MKHTLMPGPCGRTTNIPLNQISLTAIAPQSKSKMLDDMKEISGNHLINIRHSHIKESAPLEGDFSVWEQFPKDRFSILRENWFSTREGLWRSRKSRWYNCSFCRIFHCLFSALLLFHHFNDCSLNTDWRFYWMQKGLSWIIFHPTATQPV